jgi:hypothetical protein
MFTGSGRFPFQVSLSQKRPPCTQCSCKASEKGRFTTIYHDGFFCVSNGRSPEYDYIYIYYIYILSHVNIHTYIERVREKILWFTTIYLLRKWRFSIAWPIYRWLDVVRSLPNSAQICPSPIRKTTTALVNWFASACSGSKCLQTQVTNLMKWERIEIQEGRMISEYVRITFWKGLWEFPMTNEILVNRALMIDWLTLYIYYIILCDSMQSIYIFLPLRIIKQQKPAKRVSLLIKTNENNSYSKLRPQHLHPLVYLLVISRRFSHVNLQRWNWYIRGP